MPSNRIGSDVPRAPTFRKQRGRRKPPMPDLHKKRAIAARAKMQGRWTVPGFIAEGEWGNHTFRCPFRDKDKDHWWWLVAEAVGTINLSVVRYSLDALADICDRQWNGEKQDWEIVAADLNTALAIMAACEVENEAQAALAMQMVTLHFAGMRLAKGNRTYQWGGNERTLATQARIAKTMASLQMTLAKLQGKLAPRQINQTINVIYTDNRQQAVVVGGEGFSGGQGHEARGNNGLQTIEGTASPSGRAALPCPQSGGAAVPLSCGEGQASVPVAWWWQRIGRALRRT